MRVRARTDVTRIGVHAGLPGPDGVRDGSEDHLTDMASTTPSAPQAVCLVLQDRCFDAVGNLADAADAADRPADDPAPANLPPDQPTRMPEMFGDVIVVNGKAGARCRLAGHGRLPAGPGDTPAGRLQPAQLTALGRLGDPPNRRPPCPSPTPKP